MVVYFVSHPASASILLPPSCSHPRVRTLRVLSLAAVAACGIVDSDAPAPLQSSVAVEWPCERFCLDGSVRDLTLRVWGYEGGRTKQIEGVVFRLAASSDAIGLTDTLLRTDALGTASTTVSFLHAAHEATLLVTLAEKPEGVVVPQEWDAGQSVTYHVLAGPPVVSFDRDSVYVVEPGCEGEASWTITAGEDLIDVGRPDFGLPDEKTARLFAAVDDHTFVEAVGEGRTEFRVSWGYGAERFEGRIPIRVGHFVPRALTAGGGRIFLGNGLALGASVRGACETRSVGEEATFTNLSPETLSLDPMDRLITGLKLGTGRYVATYGGFVDTADVSVVDYRVLPLDTVLRVGEIFDYRPQEALDASGYRTWTGRAFYYGSYLSYSSSDTTVAAVTEKEAFFAEVRAKSPGTSTITIRMLDHHRFPWGPTRTASITVVKAD